MNQVQFHSPPISKINKWILILSGALFLISAILKAIGAVSLPAILGLSGSGISGGFIFQLVTYPFIEVSFFSFLFNGLVMWFIGSELEFHWGERIYLRFLLFIILGVAIVHSAANILLLGGTFFYHQPLIGLTGINFSLLIAYSLLYPHRQMSFMMLFPMTAKVFCWILIGIEVYMAAFSQSYQSFAHLLAMFLGFMAIRFQGHPFMRMIFKSTSMDMRARVQHLFSSKKTKSQRLRLIKENDWTAPKTEKENKKPKFWH